MNKSQSAEKGFTLIELLVVIAIISVLSVVLILTLNPAELLKQARDSNRISDLATLKSAIALYLADVSSTAIGSSTCLYSGTTALSNACTNRFDVLYSTSGQSGIFTVTSGGWVPVNFNAVSSGAPIGNLPKDPINNATYYYAYYGSSTALTFELNADMESSKYASAGGSDVETNDGGDVTTTYEVGTALTIY